MTPTSKPLAKGPDWDPDFARRSPIFAPIRALADKLPELGWPNPEVLNYLADESGTRIVNARGQRIRFVEVGKPGREGALGFEQKTYLTGAVELRAIDWHDLLNALVWMVFPTTKAAINARHVEEIEAAPQGARSVARDALTHFDEDGVVVLSSDPALSALLREFAWKELFWHRREAVRASMRFLVCGHALYQKALEPFVGMTGKALVFDLEPAALAREPARLVAEADRRTALYILDTGRVLDPQALAPLPLLGVPGWFPDNEQERFYDNTEYFRPGRSRRQSADAGR